MSEDKNVIDFGARVLAERARRQGFLLNELDGSTIRSILDAAWIDCEIDEDGDCVVDDELRFFVSADTVRNAIKFFAFFGTNGTRGQILEFCQRFNWNLVMVKAQLRETADGNGPWTVVINHDRVMFEGERIEPRTLVKLARRFEFIVRNGVSKYDTEQLF